MTLLVDALTEIVMDDTSYANLLHIFLCPKMGSEEARVANLSQRRIIKRIVETLTGKHTILEAS